MIEVAVLRVGTLGYGGGQPWFALRGSLIWLGPLLFVFLVVAAPAAAAENRFDPVLSLEGACQAHDGVADPGCPYPAFPEGPRHLEAPCGVAVDPHGDIYVSTPAGGTSNGRIDVFDSNGQFLKEILDPAEPCKLAVDSRGILYVADKKTETAEGFDFSLVASLSPDHYPPTKVTNYSSVGKFKFVRFDPEKGVDFCAQATSLAVDPTNDHLYIAHSCKVEEYGSASEGAPLNPLNKCCIAAGGGLNITAIDVYGHNHNVYVAHSQGLGSGKFESKILIYDGSTDKAKCGELDGSDTPDGPFNFELGGAIAVDQSNGSLYVYDIKHTVVERFESGVSECPEYSSEPLDFSELPSPPTNASEYVDITVDAPCRSGVALTLPCTPTEQYESPNLGFVYFTTGNVSSNSHLYAYGPKPEGPPEVRNQKSTEIDEAEATLEAELNPHALPTDYHFEYITQSQFENSNYAEAAFAPASDANVGSAGNFMRVSASIGGLAPGVAYRFRLVATNSECVTIGEGVSKSEHEPCGEGPDSTFTTYPVPPASKSSCVNDPLRIEMAKGLPDCRAYELVTPGDTNGRIPTMAILGDGFATSGFSTAMASESGDSLVFGSDSGSLPGLGGGGSEDTYRALRGNDSWESSFTGLSGIQAEKPYPGGISPDHLFAFWNVSEKQGTLADPTSERAQYLHVPPGITPSPNCEVTAEAESAVEWIGCGSLGVERQAHGKWITSGGTHVIFATESGTNGEDVQQLEPCAPPTGVDAIYDRIPGGPTRCISLLPRDSVPTENARYRGVSNDGSVVVFSVGSTLYSRLDNAVTREVATGAPVFGGVAADGRVFYLQGGDIFACDTGEGSCAGTDATQPPISIGFGGQSTLVNVSADGSRVYFVSKAGLTNGDENEWGAEAQSGAENLYVWDGTMVQFIAIVNPLDVIGQSGFGGLGLWVGSVLSPNLGTVTGPADDPSRTTPNGKTMVFESQADLTAYKNGGYREIYRYSDTGAPGNRLSCLSCNPTGLRPISDALLESRPTGVTTLPFPPVNSLTRIDNVNTNGDMVFFQSAERLTADDHDGRIDVYEWENNGMNGCERPSGCLSLISAGQSAGDDYLYATSADGDNVFFLTTDTLSSQDPDGTPSIYDARIEGGFPQEQQQVKPCLGEACQPSVVPRGDAVSASSLFEGSTGKYRTVRRRCSRKFRQTHREGRALCQKQHHRKHTRRRTRGRHRRVVR